MVGEIEPKNYIKFIFAKPSRESWYKNWLFLFLVLSIVLLQKKKLGSKVF